MKKSFLRPTAASKQSKGVLEGQPGRDHQALILPLSLIKVGENIRAEIGNIEELAESIREYGLLQPLVVRKDGSAFTLIAGHRRLMALKHMGLKEAPVRIQVADENQAQVVRLIENIQREELSGAEEVMAVAKLLPMFDGNQSALGRAIGKSQSYVSRCIRAAEIAKTYATSHSLSKSALFELADSKQPVKADGKKPTVREVREARNPSGPLSGGRYVQQAVQFRQNDRTGAFNLRVNFAPDRTPQNEKVKIIEILENILKKVRGG